MKRIAKPPPAQTSDYQPSVTNSPFFSLLLSKTSAIQSFWLGLGSPFQVTITVPWTDVRTALLEEERTLLSLDISTAVEETSQSTPQISGLILKLLAAMYRTSLFSVIWGKNLLSYTNGFIIYEIFFLTENGGRALQCSLNATKAKQTVCSCFTVNLLNPNPNPHC